MLGAAEAAGCVEALTLAPQNIARSFDSAQYRTFVPKAIQAHLKVVTLHVVSNYSPLSLADEADADSYDAA